MSSASSEGPNLYFLHKTVLNFVFFFLLWFNFEAYSSGFSTKKNNLMHSLSRYKNLPVFPSLLKVNKYKSDFYFSSIKRRKIKTSHTSPKVHRIRWRLELPNSSPRERPSCNSWLHPFSKVNPKKGSLPGLCRDECWWCGGNSTIWFRCFGG